MIATNEETLTELFTAAIVGMTPRLQYKGAESWKPYERENSGPSRTRHFRMVWVAGNIQPRGTLAGNIIEHYATLRVRTDYAGEHAKQQHIIIDDFHQLGDVLSALKSTDNGVVLVERIEPRERRGFFDENDVVRVDHTYRVRFLRNIRP